MQNLIPIDELDKLSDLELIELGARLRDLILTADLRDTDLRSCLASLSNAIYVRQRRPSLARSEIRAP